MLREKSKAESRLGFGASPEFGPPLPTPTTPQGTRPICVFVYSALSPNRFHPLLRQLLSERLRFSPTPPPPLRLLRAQSFLQRPCGPSSRNACSRVGRRRRPELHRVVWARSDGCGGEAGRDLWEFAGCATQRDSDAQVPREPPPHTSRAHLEV